jgi:DNA polymerase-3 subunit alpha
MLFLSLEDLYDQVEIIVFPKTLEKTDFSMEKEMPILVQGRLQLKEDEPPKIIAEKIERLTVDMKKNKGRHIPNKLYVRFIDEDREKMETVHKLLKHYEKKIIGNGRKMEVIFYIQSSQKKMRIGVQLMVNKELIEKIDGILGPGNAKVG